MSGLACEYSATTSILAWFCLFGRLHLCEFFRGRWVPRVQVTLAPMMWTILLLCCGNLQSIDIKSDAVLPIFLSQTQHECCLFVVSSSVFILCLCWVFFKSGTWRASSLARWKSCAYCSIFMSKTWIFFLSGNIVQYAMLTMIAQGIAKLEYAVNCLWWEIQRFIC